MITNTGKNILAKYLVGQTSSYASHIAIGCGAKPLNTTDDFEDYSSKKTLDLEMFRVPVISRGYVNEDGISKIVFTGELPTTERYEITEVGVFSAGSNPSAAGYDSKSLLLFSQTENWEYHNQTASVPIPQITESLGEVDAPQVISQTSPVFRTNSDNKTMQTETRILRYEPCRFLNTFIAMAGNDATINITDGHLVPTSESNHIHLTNSTFSLDKNALTDQIKAAFSIISKDGNSTQHPDEVRILLEAASDDTGSSTQFARFEIVIKNSNLYDFSVSSNLAGTYNPTTKTLTSSTNGQLQIAGIDVAMGDVLRLDSQTDSTQNGYYVMSNAGTVSTPWVMTKDETLRHDFNTNRYVVVTKELKDLYRSSAFTWSGVNTTKIFASVIKNNEPTGDFYVALDVVRLENVTTENPLYGLTGYTVIKNTQAKPIVKLSNTTNLVEFRFGIDVGVV